jgi:hypothetical protein
MLTVMDDQEIYQIVLQQQGRTLGLGFIGQRWARIFWESRRS